MHKILNETEKERKKREGHDCLRDGGGGLLQVKESIARGGTPGRGQREQDPELGHVRRRGGERGEPDQEAQKVMGGPEKAT